MCTQEYVKPSKSNISDVCMHLTNYAVNKNSDGFVQPSAESSENADGQDDASKRSLKWFMDWYKVTQAFANPSVTNRTLPRIYHNLTQNFTPKDQFGPEKTKQLWKRMGTIIVRTVLSILPTLTREYDQHFKSFNNVPCKRTTKSMANPAEKTEKEKVAKNRSVSKNSDQDEEFDKEEEEEEEEEEEDGEEEENGGGVAVEDGESGSGDIPRPEFRGSRCFEVLGLDIMIDNHQKPWMIEVNHLPSFGTDSPLDLDIKERLMEQVHL